MYRYVAPALLAILASRAFAAAWGTNTTITGYYVYAAGGSFLKVADMENPDGCASVNYLALDTNAAESLEASFDNPIHTCVRFSTEGQSSHSSIGGMNWSETIETVGC